MCTLCVVVRRVGVALIEQLADTQIFVLQDSRLLRPLRDPNDLSHPTDRSVRRTWLVRKLSFPSSSTTIAML